MVCVREKRERGGRGREEEIKNKKTYTDTSKVIKREKERRTSQKATVSNI